MPCPLSRRLPGSTLLLALLAAHPAMAQQVTGPADVSRVRERATPPMITQPTDQLVEVQGMSTAAAPPGSDKFMLKLSGVSFEGLTVYSEPDLAPLYAASVGQQVSVADVYQLAANITRKYRNDGYILTQVVVPPQTIESGQVHLQVVEGFIDSVVVDGVPDATERALIMAYAEQAKGGPLNTRRLEQAVLLINGLPGVTARSIISPSPTVPGGANLRVMVTRKRFEGEVGVNNFGTRFLGRPQGQLALSGNSLLGLNERISADLIYAPGNDGVSKELAYGDVVYNQPIGRFGTTVELAASFASTDPGFTLKPFDVNGQSATYSINVNQPIIRNRGLNWSVYGLFDARNDTTRSNIDITRRDYIRALRFGTNLDYLDGLLGGGYNSLNLQVAQGIGLFGASDDGAPDLSRPDGDPRFTKLEAEGQRLQRITGNLNLLVGLRGQLSNAAQLSSEEFGVGGPRYGRGYDPSEIVGDDGISGKAELQLNNPYPVDFTDTYQVYGFLDAGRVWNDDATTVADDEISLVSTGVGLRTTLLGQTEADLFVALPLNRDVQTEGDQNLRFFFSLSQRF